MNNDAGEIPRLRELPGYEEFRRTEWFTQFTMEGLRACTIQASFKKFKQHFIEADVFLYKIKANKFVSLAVDFAEEMKAYLEGSQAERDSYVGGEFTRITDDMASIIAEMEFKYKYAKAFALEYGNRDTVDDLNGDVLDQAQKLLRDCEAGEIAKDAMLAQLRALYADQTRMSEYLNAVRFDSSNPDTSVRY